MPRMDYRISVGDLVAIIVAILSVGAIYGQVNARVDFIDENGTKASRAILREMQDLRIEMVRLKTVLEEREKKEQERHGVN